LDISNNHDLIGVFLAHNYLNYIDLSQNINLKYLNLSHNKLISINVSQNINLKKLNLSHNNLSVIDISDSLISFLNINNNEPHGVVFTNKIRKIYYQKFIPEG
jgi:uncharacterized protein YjbI with pentapeptide repeats